MEFQELLDARRMVRCYSPDPVDPARLDRIASAAIRTPSAGNTRATAVVLVTDPAQRRAIAEAADEPSFVARGFDPWLTSAPAMLAICVSEPAYRLRYELPDKRSSQALMIPYWWVDAGAALMASLLAAVDEGLAAGFLGAHAIPELERILELPESVDALGIVTIGYPLPDRRSNSIGREPAIRQLHQDRWSDE